MLPKAGFEPMVHNATESYGMIPSTTHARRIRLTRLNELIENLKRCLFFHSKLEPFKIFICLKKRYVSGKYKESFRPSKNLKD